MEIKGASLLLWPQPPVGLHYDRGGCWEWQRGWGLGCVLGSSPPAHFLKHVLEPPGKGERKVALPGKAASCFFFCPCSFESRLSRGPMGCSVVVVVVGS